MAVIASRTVANYREGFRGAPRNSVQQQRQQQHQWQHPLRLPILLRQLHPRLLLLQRLLRDHTPHTGHIILRVHARDIARGVDDQ